MSLNYMRIRVALRDQSATSRGKGRRRGEEVQSPENQVETLRQTRKQVLQRAPKMRGEGRGGGGLQVGRVASAVLYQLRRY